VDSLYKKQISSYFT